MDMVKIFTNQTKFFMFELPNRVQKALVGHCELLVFSLYKQFKEPFSQLTFPFIELYVRCLLNSSLLS
jgi:hypothetical protein